MGNHGNRMEYLKGCFLEKNVKGFPFDFVFLANNRLLRKNQREPYLRVDFYIMYIMKYK